MVFWRENHPFLKPFLKGRGKGGKGGSGGNNEAESNKRKVAYTLREKVQADLDIEARPKACRAVRSQYPALSVHLFTRSR